MSSPAVRPARLPLIIAGAVLLALFAAIFAMRQKIVYQLLGDDFRTSAGGEGSWEEPRARQVGRMFLACQDRGGSLRLLHWAGIDGDRSVDDAALGCAATVHGMKALGVLIAIGDDVDRPVLDRRFGPLAFTPPLAHAMNGAAGIPVAQVLLAHGASLGPTTPDGFDAVQGAAASRCMPCLLWLKQQGAAFDRVAPATPMTLWLDNRSFLPSDLASLEKLVSLGMSATAVGADGRSPLHAAAAHTDGAAVAWLLRQGLDPTRVDRFGMTPLLYAAFDDVYHVGMGPEARAVVVDLMARTPTLQPPAPQETLGQSAIDYRANPMKTPYDFSDAASHDPTLRAAAREQGKPVRYTKPEMIDRLPADERLAALADLDDAALALATRPDSPWLTDAAEHGAWPVLARAMKGWPSPERGRPSEPLACKLLVLAVSGTNDPSPDRADSWIVARNWTRTGVQISNDCTSLQEGEIKAAMAGRSAAQKASVKGVPGLWFE